MQTLEWLNEHKEDILATVTSAFIIVDHAIVKIYSNVVSQGGYLQIWNNFKGPKTQSEGKELTTNKDLKV